MKFLFQGYSSNPNILNILNGLLRYTRDKKAQENKEKKISLKVTKYALSLLSKGPLSSSKEQK